MVLKTKSFQTYHQIMKEKDLNLSLLTKTSELNRLVEMLIKIESKFLLPRDENISLQLYALKLINKAVTIIVSDKNHDIGLLSFYANDYVGKNAFCSSIGVISSHRGGSIARNLVKFGFDYLYEIGMETIRTEVDKKNLGVVSFLKNFNFHIESETEENTYILVADLKNHQIPFYEKWEKK